MEQQHKRSAFSGKIGFVLSAAGASVGLGNIWRFPYLAAKYGGGIFLLVYILLAVTFGYTMIVAETALGRMTHKSPVSAYAHFGKGKGIRFGGWINAIIPILIVPYYSVIGGWVIHYLAEYLCGRGSNLAADGYFSAFITNGLQAELAFWLLCHPSRCTGGCEVFSGAQPQKLLLDDRGHRHGADVLFSVHCHGHSGHLRLLYEEGRLYRGVHRERGGV